LADAPRGHLQIALATCAALPDLDPDDQLLLEPLRAAGVEATPAVWDDPGVDWNAYDLVVIRSTWDYTNRRDAFVAWAQSVPRLVNPADVIAWNTDKRYLADLAAAGLPVVPTTWISNPPVELPIRGPHVLKPSVGAGSIDAARYSLHDEHEHRLAHAHAARLLAAGHTVMVQPYLEEIETAGEAGLIFIGGAFSHAITKGAMLASSRPKEAGGLYVQESIWAREPSNAELELAELALAAVPGGAERLAYARVDIVPSASGAPLIIELELTEPSLFMHTAPGSAQRFAEALAGLAAA
jgi:glutathione synthase/RimK-type ligase-like ATP-grasp enzyme